jgi:hypothetical protein
MNTLLSVLERKDVWQTYPQGPKITGTSAMTDKDKKDESTAVNEARQADKNRPDKEKDAVAANPHRDNVNTNAYSEESARDPGDITTYSINEPGPGDPVAFKVPEDHTATTPETLEQAYPEGYVAPETPEQHDQHVKAYKQAKADEVAAKDDPDDLEDEIDQAKEEGDFKSSGYKPTHKPSTTKRK